MPTSLIEMLRPHKMIAVNVPDIGRELRLFVHSGGEYISQRLQELKVWEPTETTCFCTLVKPGDHVLDVGANIGYYSILAAHLTGPAGKVICVEPHPGNFALLKRNLRINGVARHVEAIRAAASAKGGPMRLFCSPVNSGDHRTYKSDEARHSLMVKTLALGELMSKHSHRFALVKIDCQGAEEDIFRGMEDSLSNPSQRPQAIIVEFWPYGLETNGGYASRFLDRLASLPYKIVEIGRWASRTRATTVTELRQRMEGELAAHTKVHTNLLLIDERLKDLVSNIRPPSR